MLPSFTSNPNLLWWAFLALILLIMGAVFFLAGAFLAFFGSGKASIYGAVQVVLGLVLVGFVFIGAWSGVVFPAELTLFPDVIQPAALVLAGVVLGAVLPAVVFLMVLARS